MPAWDRDAIGPAELKPLICSDRAKFLDFHEATPSSPIKKVAGVYNFNLTGSREGQNLKAMDDQDRALQRNRDYVVGNAKMNIKDIRGVTYTSVEPPDKKGKKAPAKLVDGMSPLAHATFEQMLTDVTRRELGVSNKTILIPSFQTTSKLFAQHFTILRELRHRVFLLKQASEDQRSSERSWDQIDAVIVVLDEACKYLDMPEEKPPP